MHTIKDKILMALGYGDLSALTSFFFLENKNKNKLAFVRPKFAFDSKMYLFCVHSNSILYP
jgi:hypothetical protein